MSGQLVARSSAQVRTARIVRAAMLLGAVVLVCVDLALKALAESLLSNPR